VKFPADAQLPGVLKALERLGKEKYGWLEAIYIGIRERLQKYIVLPQTNFSGEICSEFVAKVFDLSQVHISPGKLYNVLIETNSELKVQIRK